MNNIVKKNNSNRVSGGTARIPWTPSTFMPPGDKLSLPIERLLGCQRKASLRSCGPGTLKHPSVLGRLRIREPMCLHPNNQKVIVDVSWMY
jgi:hypothetical protein